MATGLSVLVPTYNNEKTIRATLESVKWADEILVVDSYSTDRTLEICREYTDRVVQHVYVNSAKQKNRALPQCKYDWVLQIDSDEQVEDELREEIQHRLANVNQATHAFFIPRKNHVLGVWLKRGGIYPDYQARLFRRSEGCFEDKEVHARLKVQGHVETLRHHILHFGMPTLSKQLRNLDRYSRYQADELRKQGKRFRWHNLVIRPFAAFCYYFFWKLGFLSGYRGFLVAVVDAAQVFWSHAKLWELEESELDRSPL